jgi:hypothetical protein
MTIGDVRSHDPSEPKASQTLNDTTPPIRDHEQDQEDEQEEPQDKDQVHDQEENNNQVGDEDDGDHK